MRKLIISIIILFIFFQPVYAQTVYNSGLIEHVDIGSTYLPTEGLVGWYRAETINLSDNDTISLWEDQSGSGNDMVQTSEGDKPFYNSDFNTLTSSVQFRGSQHFELPSALSVNARDMSIFFICRDTLGTLGTSAEKIYAAVGGGTNYLYKVLDTPVSKRLGLYSNVDKASALAIQNQLAIHGVSTTATNTVFRINDLKQTVASAAVSATLTGGTIGYGFQESYHIISDIVEVLIYNHALTDTEYLWLSDYAFKQYNIVYNYDDQVLFYGNSLTTGVGVTYAEQNYPNVLQDSLSKTVKTVNLGISGVTTATLVSSAATNIDSLYSSTLFKKNIAVLWEVRNDLCEGLVDQATALSNLVSLAQGRKTAGFGTVVLTALPSGGCPANYETDRAAINTEILTNFVSSGYADAVVDLTSTDLEGHSATYFVDTVHLNAAGYAIVAAEVKTALNSLGIKNIN